MVEHPVEVEGDVPSVVVEAEDGVGSMTTFHKYQRGGTYYETVCYIIRTKSRRYC